MNDIEKIEESIEKRKEVLKIQEEGYEQVEYMGGKIGDSKSYKTYIKKLSLVFEKLTSDKNLKVYLGDISLSEKWMDGVNQLQNILYIAYPLLEDKNLDPIFKGYLYVKLYHSGFGHAIDFFRKIAIIINKKYIYINKKSEDLTDNNCIKILKKYDNKFNKILKNFDTTLRNCIAHENYILNKDNSIDFLKKNGTTFKKKLIDISKMFSEFSLLNNALIVVVINFEIQYLTQIKKLK